MLKKYLSALKQSWKDLYTHPLVFLGIIGLIISFIIIAQIFGNLGLVGGMILGLAQIAGLSIYFNWLNLCQARRSLKLKDLPEFNYSLFIAVLNVAFVLFICDLMLRSFADSPIKALAIGINLLVVIAFNVLPEVINKYQYHGLTSFSVALDFMKSRWLEWLAPLLIPIIPMLIFTPKTALLQYAMGNPLMPFLNVFGNFAVFSKFEDNLFFLLIPLIIFAHWLMLFRRRLYDQFA